MLKVVCWIGPSVLPSAPVKEDLSTVHMLCSPSKNPDNLEVTGEVQSHA